MEQKYPHLCSPITIGKTVFRNRMFSAPMGGTDITKDGCIGPRSLKFYELRAYGGAAAVTVSECMVHPSDGSHAFRLDLSVPESLPSFAYTADAIKRHGAVPSLELSHSGQYAGTYLADKDKKASLAQWGPSAHIRPDGVEVKALDKAMIDEIVAAYGSTAANAKRAGFEMLMVHAGHGWLINQFLSPLFNHRTDEYGGSFENRVRFAREVLTAVRNAVGPWFPIELRMSGDEFVEGGYHLDEGVKIAQALEDLVDIIHVSAGTYQGTFGITHPSWFEEHGRNVYLAAEIKKHVKKPVATIGGLSDPAMMEEIIASGKADIVEMARQLLADNQLPNKVMSNRDDEIVHCIRCFTCMAERPATFTRRCTCNPLIGRETEGLGELQPSPHPKKVLVVGGGPGGLYAAYTAARRGHKVTLCEATDKTGGLLIGEAAIPFKYDMYLLGETYRHLAEKEGVEIRLNTRVDRAYVEREARAAAAAHPRSAGEPHHVPRGGLSSQQGKDRRHLHRPRRRPRRLRDGGVPRAGRQERPHRRDALGALPGRERALPSAPHGGDGKVQREHPHRLHLQECQWERGHLRDAQRRKGGDHRRFHPLRPRTRAEHRRRRGAARLRAVLPLHRQLRKARHHHPHRLSGLSRRA